MKKITPYFSRVVSNYKSEFVRLKVTQRALNCISRIRIESQKSNFTRRKTPTDIAVFEKRNFLFIFQANKQVANTVYYHCISRSIGLLCRYPEGGRRIIEPPRAEGLRKLFFYLHVIYIGKDSSKHLLFLNFDKFIYRR